MSHELNLPSDGRPTMSAEELKLTLEEEFVRLNLTHFNGKLNIPDISISTRKIYGGYYQLKQHRIVVSWQAYVEHGVNETMNTFRHEVAHIVHQNHSKDFWDLAYQIGVTNRYAAPSAKKRTLSPKYLYQCPNCNNKILRHRIMRKSSCGKCDAKYNPRYLLQCFKLTSGA